MIVKFAPGTEVAIRWMTGMFVVEEVRLTRHDEPSYTMSQSDEIVGYFDENELYIPEEWA